METFLMKALQLIVALMLLVTVHEFGHYIFARIFGIRVNRFYLFFNPWFSLLKYYPEKGKMELIAWTTQKKEKDADGKEKVVEETPHALLTFKCGKPHSATNKKGRPSWAATLYGIGWLPLGGYCDIDGMVDETTTADKLGSEVKPWEFRSKPAWQRFLVMVAGVLFNFILAIAIYAGIAFHWGEKVVAYQDVYEGMDFCEPMHKAGFADGDVLLAVNGKAIDPRDMSTVWDLMQPGTHVTVLRGHADTVKITVPKEMLEEVAAMNSSPMGYRIPVYADQVQNGLGAAKGGMLDGDRVLKINNDTTPSLTEFFAVLDKCKNTTAQMLVERDGKTITLPVDINADGKIGIVLRPADKIYPVHTIEYNFLESIPRGWQMGTDQLVTYVSSLKLLFTKTGVQQVGGFGTLGSLFPEKWNWLAFWQITAFLSVILAFMNIIPIPALDGGHVLFLFIEMITGKKVPDKVMEVANTAGFVFLFLLLIYANANDIIRQFL